MDTTTIDRTDVSNEIANQRVPGRIVDRFMMSDTTFLLLIGTLSILWWACVWGVFDMVVSFTKRPLFCYVVGIVVITLFLYQYPHIADRLI